MVPPVRVDWHEPILTAHVLKPQMGESVEESMKMEPEPWIIQEMFLGDAEPLQSWCCWVFGVGLF